MKRRLKLFAVVQLAVCLVVVLGQKWWCQFIHFMDLDWCWVMSASAFELERAFSNHHVLLYSLNLGLDYGLPLVSLIVLLYILGKGRSQDLILLMVSSLFTLLLAEGALRLTGKKPGQFAYSPWAQPVDSLYMLKGTTADSLGLMKVDTAIAHFLEGQSLHFERNDRSYSDSAAISHELVVAIHDHTSASRTEQPMSEFWEHVYTLAARLDSVGDEQILLYADHPINDEGFYSIPFDTTGAGDRILLLGDSFTWGHSASKLTGSFSNLLLARGYSVFNTGISGADVPQYKGILQHYGPQLKPKVVVLNFFMGNDVSYFNRVPRPFVPVHYTTNAGNILSFQNGVLFSTMQEAYDNLMSNMVIPQTTTLNRWMSKTVVTTMLWEFLAHQHLVDHVFFVGEPYPEHPLTRTEIESVSRVCDSLGATLILSVIPKLENGEVVGAESIPGLFGDVPYHQPKVSPSLYNLKDGHFNDEGHRFYADYLEALLQEELTHKTSANRP